MTTGGVARPRRRLTQVVGVAVALVVALPLLSALRSARAAPGAGGGAPVAWGAAARMLEPGTRARVLEEAQKAVSTPPRPVQQLASAGSEDVTDSVVVATRAAFEDADDTLILAMAWTVSGEPRYRDAAANRLRAWAGTNVPTGSPIDETRLDALVNAYTLMREALAPEDDAAVRAWFTTMRERKRAWRFGPWTTRNNHRTHQLKMLLLLDRALGDEAAFAADRAAAEAHAASNLDAQTGESLDLRERGALYYHAYNLDAWLEIALATGCCTQPVTAAYQLLERRLLAGETAGEFVGSAAPLDAIRARAGFGYGEAGSTFDPRRAEHAVLAFYTLPLAPRAAPPPPLAPEARHVQRRNLYALARYQSWKR
ncbi:MAG: alginate lyase family protein [Pseudomonadota bacterium]|nr:alginate lyase family protein [Pseudomonadota bacterium]